MATSIKEALLKVKLDGILHEIILKMGAENVSYTTEQGTTTTVAAQLAAVIAECAKKPTTDAMNSAIEALEQKLLGDVPAEAYDTFTELAQYIEEHKEASDALTAAIGNKADKTTVEAIQEAINGLGALASKSAVAESDLDTDLKAKVNAAAAGTHSHSNKALLDTYTQTEANLADAVNKKHEHANAEELNKIAVGDKAKWDKAVTDLAEEVTRAKAAEEAAQTTANEAAGKVNTLVGEDTGKSARTIANEELAKQLVAENAGEALDTLNEIAQWIQDHPGDAAAMNAAIEALEAKVDTGDKTVSAYVTAAIEALKIGDYATAENLTALAGRVETLEGKAHEHSNKAVLDGITAENVASWNRNNKVHVSTTEPTDMQDGELWLQIVE